MNRPELICHRRKVLQIRRNPQLRRYLRKARLLKDKAKTNNKRYYFPWHKFFKAFVLWVKNDPAVSRIESLVHQPYLSIAYI